MEVEQSNTEINRISVMKLRQRERGGGDCIVKKWREIFNGNARRAGGLKTIFLTTGPGDERGKRQQAERVKNSAQYNNLKISN